MCVNADDALLTLTVKALPRFKLVELRLMLLALGIEVNFNVPLFLSVPADIPVINLKLHGTDLVPSAL